jgi:tetratricopeptide (TPR) repeat protein
MENINENDSKLNSTEFEKDDEIYNNDYEDNQVIHDQVEAIEGSLYKLKIGFLGGISWKKKWVYADKEKLAYWNGNVKPPTMIKPCDVFDLENCDIFKNDEREYCIKIVSKKMNADGKEEHDKTLILAAETEVDLNLWLEYISPMECNDCEENDNIYNNSINSDYILTGEEKDITLYSSRSSESNLLTNKNCNNYKEILSYFQLHNSSMIKIDPKITLSMLQNLITTFYPDMNISAAGYIFHDFDINDGLISYSQFSTWFDLYNRDDTTTVSNNNDNQSSSNNASVNDTESGIILSKLNKCKRIESIHFVGIVDSFSVEESIDHPRQLLQNKTPKFEEKKDEEEINQNISCNDWNDKYQTLIEKSTNDNSVSNCFSLMSFYGDFLKCSSDGAKKIVDGYCVPNEMNGNCELDLFCDELDESSREENYKYNGLLFRVGSIAVSESDRVLSDTLKCYFIGTDDIKHKVIGNEHRSLIYVQNAIYDMYDENMADYKHKLNNYNLNMDTQDKPCFPIKPCTVLSTVVDYGGFRITVYIPHLGINEEKTLVNGFSLNNNLYVNSSNSVSEIIPLLSNKLNLVTYKKEMKVINNRLCESSKVGSTELCKILTNDLQVHNCVDNRSYLLNFGSILPSTVPKKDSCDILTSVFRPEFILSNAKKLSPETFRLLDFEEEVAEKEETNNNKNTKHVHFKFDNEDLNNSLEANNHLYTVTLPLVASKLDSLSYVPIDSYGFTEFLHSHGVNMRLMGPLYSLSKILFIKRMILSEAIARTCKGILKHGLKDISRRSKAESIAAQFRGRSTEKHYEEHNDVVNKEKKLLMLDLFNLVLGQSTQTSTFWSGLLANRLFHKFGINLENIPNLYSILHFPQLFLSLQYHTGVVFADKANYNFNDPKVSSPLQLSDISSCSNHIIKCKFPIPGCIGHYTSKGDSFLVCGLYEDAAVAFKIQLTSILLSISEINSPKEISILGHTTYKYALSLFLAGSYDTASDIIQSFIQSYPKNSALSGRMLTFLMSCMFKQSKYTNAMKYFDLAQEVYKYSLGLSHPVHSLHFCALGDLYYSIERNKQAILMITFALESSKKILGVDHILCAIFSTKLSAIQVKEKSYNQSSKLLLNAVVVFEAALAKGANLVLDNSVCCYILATSLIQSQDFDFAINCTNHSMELTARNNNLDSNESTHLASCLLLLADLFLKKNDYVATSGFFQEAWVIIKNNPNSFPNAAVSLAKITCRLIGIQYSSFSLQNRILVDSVEKEMKLFQKSNDIKINSQSLYNACEIVVQKLWKIKPEEYFKSLITRFAECELKKNGKINYYIIY